MILSDVAIAFILYRYEKLATALMNSRRYIRTLLCTIEISKYANDMAGYYHTVNEIRCVSKRLDARKELRRRF